MMSQKDLKKPLKRGSKKRKRHKLKTLTKFVIFSFTCLILYTIVSQVLAYETAVRNMPVDLSTLTTCFFAAFGGEVLVCALMKMLKLKKGIDNGDSIDTFSDMQCDDQFDNGSTEEDLRGDESKLQ